MKHKKALVTNFQRRKIFNIEKIPHHHNDNIMKIENQSINKQQHCQKWQDSNQNNDSNYNQADYASVKSKILNANQKLKTKIKKIESYQPTQEDEFAESDISGSEEYKKRQVNSQKQKTFNESQNSISSYEESSSDLDSDSKDYDFQFTQSSNELNQTVG
ncbi:UNKNOWN [Stylonychia lemnae]|uniref:Uncharacterized protein n=1 Tax=Stylonychia lemnae TaxID=5949 RepID=A0A078AGV5_STYLE|nr:UNKNOWN [Stylonychia lemnae]|eukprot:CDW81449.1 UNKNOWN [Stylonychia lemnae]